MNRDIVGLRNGDLDIQVGDAPKAMNVLRVQLGSLEYAPSFGIDLAYFLQSELAFQNVSFEAYCVERLIAHQINVVSVSGVLDTFMKTLTFSIGSNKNGTGFVI